MMIRRQTNNRDVEESGQPRRRRKPERAGSNPAIPTDVDGQAGWYPTAGRPKDKGRR